jgi:hypothetical protein
MTPDPFVISYTFPMDWITLILVVAGLCLFETITSIDNAIINAEVLSTMGERARRWFLLWGILIAVFLVRGLLPWLIVWATAPDLGFIGAFTATLQTDPEAQEEIQKIIERASPVLLAGGGTFLVFLFFHWLFQEEKRYGLVGEKYIHRHGVWFYAVVSVLLSALVWAAIEEGRRTENEFLALGLVVGSTAFFITHGFKQNAEQAERELMAGKGNLSDLSKIFYLEVIDTTFSIDGVLGAFAFTYSVPLILLGNGLGAIAVRQLTIGNIERVKKYAYLKNGAMYSVFFLGVIMLLRAFHVHVPEWVSPVITFAAIGFFFAKSVREVRRGEAAPPAGEASDAGDGGDARPMS